MTGMRVCSLLRPSCFFLSFIAPWFVTSECEWRSDLIIHCVISLLAFNVLPFIRSKNSEPIFGASWRLVMKKKQKKEARFFLSSKRLWSTQGPQFSSHLHPPIPPLGITWFTPRSRVKFCFHLCGFSWVWTEDMTSSSFDEKFFNEFFDLFQLLGIYFQTPQKKHTQQKQPLDLMFLPPREVINHALSPLPSNPESVSGPSLMNWY